MAYCQSRQLNMQIELLLMIRQSGELLAWKLETSSLTSTKIANNSLHTVVSVNLNSRADKQI